MLHAVRPGGGIVLTVPLHPWLWSHQEEYACYVCRYRVGELRDKVVRAGFDVLYETAFVSLLLPAMLTSRLARRQARTEADTISELRLPAPINRLFEMVMDFERMLLQSGVRFPAGGSCLLVATKRQTKSLAMQVSISKPEFTATDTAFPCKADVGRVSSHS